MFARAINFDEVGTRRDGLRHSGFFIQLRAELVVISNRQAGAQAHAARIGRHLAEYQFDQGGFAGTVRANQPDLVATQNAAGKIPDDLTLTQTFVHTLEFRHELARASPLRNRD